MKDACFQLITQAINVLLRTMCREIIEDIIFDAWWRDTWEFSSYLDQRRRRRRRRDEEEEEEEEESDIEIKVSYPLDHLSDKDKLIFMKLVEKNDELER